MKKLLANALITFFVLLSSSITLAQSEDPFIGSWDIILAESDFGSSVPPLNMSRSYTDIGNGSYAYQVVRVNPDQTLSLTSAIYSFDGKEYPIVSLDEFEEPALISYRKINAETVDYTVRIGGVVTQIGAKFISPDHQRLSISIQFPNTDQKNQVLIFKRR